jgi:hypothetical protein
MYHRARFFERLNTETKIVAGAFIEAKKGCQKFLNSRPGDEDEPYVYEILRLIPCWALIQELVRILPLTSWFQIKFSYPILYSLTICLLGFTDIKSGVYTLQASTCNMTCHHRTYSGLGCITPIEEGDMLARATSPAAATLLKLGGFPSLYSEPVAISCRIERVWFKGSRQL